MSHEIPSDRDRSFALAKRTHDLIRDYGPCATPRAYAVWYAYASGESPLLGDAVKRLTTQNGRLTELDIDDLHETYLDGRRLANAADDVGRMILTEIAAVTEILDLSLGSTAQYGESLRGLAHDLAQGPPSRARLGEILSTLVSTTREVAVNNRVLEARMRDTRGEIETLRETLEATRLESLTDTLTGLSNRKQFEETLKATIEAARLRPSPMSLIILDIDFFKRFNDLYGHLTGDQVLRLVAIVMRESAGKQAHARPVRRRGIRHRAARVDRAGGPAAGRDRPGQRDGARADQALHRRVARQDHGLAGRGGAAPGRHAGLADGAGRPVHVRRQARGPQPRRGRRGRVPVAGGLSGVGIRPGPASGPRRPA